MASRRGRRGKGREDRTAGSNAQVYFFLFWMGKASGPEIFGEELIRTCT